MNAPPSPAESTRMQVRAAVRDGSRTTLTAVLVSAVLAGVKIAAGVFGNSFALIADGVESIFDIFSAVLVWGGLRIGALPQSERFPYGRGKAEPLAALFVATMLLAAAVGIAVGAVGQILNPHTPPAAFTLVVLVVVVVVKEGLFRMVSRAGVEHGSQALYSDAWHHRSDALTSLAAFVGISIALLAGPRFASADDWAALAACSIIAWNGGRLFKAAAEDVLDATPPPAVNLRVRALAASVPGVTGIDVVRVRPNGLVFLVDIHVEVDAMLTVMAGHEIAHRVKDCLMGSELPILDVLVHIEPGGS